MADVSTVVYAVDGEELPYVVHAPQATQLQVNSNLASAWNTGGGATATQAGPGLDGAIDGAVTLEDADAVEAVFAALQLTLPTTDTRYVFRIAIAYDPSPAGYVRVSVGVDGLTREIFNFHPGTGVISDRGGTGVKHVTRGMDEAGPYWFVYVEFHNSVSNANFTTVVYPVFTTTAAGAAVGSLVGSVVIGNTELYQADSYLDVIDYPPIFTDGAAVTRDADGYSFDSANHDETNGAWYFETDSGLSAVGRTAADQYLYLGDLGVAEFAYGGRHLMNMATTGTDVQGPSGGLDKDGEVTCGVVYDNETGLARNNTHNEWGDEQSDYVGVPLSGALSVMAYSAGKDVVNSIRNIQRWSGTYEDLVAKIEELMS